MNASNGWRNTFMRTLYSFNISKITGLLSYILIVIINLSKLIKNITFCLQDHLIMKQSFILNHQIQKRHYVLFNLVPLSIFFLLKPFSYQLFFCQPIPYELFFYQPFPYKPFLHRLFLFKVAFILPLIFLFLNFPVQLFFFIITFHTFFTPILIIKIR